MNKVNAVGDAELTAKFNALINSGFYDKATSDFFVYLLESTEKALQ